MTVPAARSGVRLAELLAVLSLASDLAVPGWQLRVNPALDFHSQGAPGPAGSGVSVSRQLPEAGSLTWTTRAVST
jgi:hypothetical protein